MFKRNNKPAKTNKKSFKTKIIKEIIIEMMIKNTMKEEVTIEVIIKRDIKEEAISRTIMTETSMVITIGEVKVIIRSTK
jgi:hypothetical protein